MCIHEWWNDDDSWRNFRNRVNSVVILQEVFDISLIFKWLGGLPGKLFDAKTYSIFTLVTLINEDESSQSNVICNVQ